MDQMNIGEADNWFGYISLGLIMVEKVERCWKISHRLEGGKCITKMTQQFHYTTTATA
jgi:hypothetical protein